MITGISTTGAPVTPTFIRTTTTQWCPDVASAFRTTFPQLPMHQHVVYFGECVLTVAFGVKPPPGLVIMGTFWNVPNVRSEHPDGSIMDMARDFVTEIVHQRKRLDGCDTPRSNQRIEDGYLLPSVNHHHAVFLVTRHHITPLSVFFLTFPRVDSEQLLYDAHSGALVLTASTFKVIDEKIQRLANIRHFDYLVVSLHYALKARRDYGVEFTIDKRLLSRLSGPSYPRVWSLQEVYNTGLPTFRIGSFYPSPLCGENVAIARMVSLLLQCGLLELDWSHLLLAGGAVLYCVDLASENWVGENTMDLNFYIYDAPSLEEVVQGFLRVVRVTRPDAEVVISPKVITILGVYPIRHVQINLRHYEDPSHVLRRFDLPCCRFGYDGKNFYRNGGALRALSTRVMICHRVKELTRPRQSKYVKRLFSFVHLQAEKPIFIADSGNEESWTTARQLCGCHGFKETSSPTIPWGPDVTEYDSLFSQEDGPFPISALSHTALPL